MRVLLLTSLFPFLTSSSALAQDVTFARDIAPIVFNSCTSCHRSGGPAPFSLATYDEVRRRATQIAQVTRSRFMPPWKVEPEIGDFVGQHPLTDRQIALIETWAKTGAAPGNLSDLPAMPQSPPGWLLCSRKARCSAPPPVPFWRSSGICWRWE